ncbi:hypothetical protein [Tumebacillus algifaecis]|nr:hypothetical protein [Tumebacillus algifaecis]
MNQKLKSKKFWAAVLSAVLFVAVDQFGWGVDRSVIDTVIDALLGGV